MLTLYKFTFFMQLILRHCIQYQNNFLQMLMSIQHGLLKYYFTALITLPTSASECEIHNASNWPLLKTKSWTVSRIQLNRTAELHDFPGLQKPLLKSFPGQIYLNHIPDYLVLCLFNSCYFAF